MIGPKPRGFWTTNLGPTGGGDFLMLRAGGRYYVTTAFRDFDGDEHAVGEAWTFVGHSFLPHDDGLSLFVSIDGRDEWHIRMQWRPNTQGPILDSLANYIAPSSG